MSDTTLDRIAHAIEMKYSLDEYNVIDNPEEVAKAALDVLIEDVEKSLFMSKGGNTFEYRVLLTSISEYLTSVKGD